MVNEIVNNCLQNEMTLPGLLRRARQSWRLLRETGVSFGLPNLANEPNHTKKTKAANFNL
jgi:hypothetical protein